MFGKKIFGLDISDYSLEVLEISKFFGRYNIRSYSRLKLEPGVVENGFILNEAKLATAIKEVLATAKPKKISTNQVAICLPESRILSSIIRLPADLQKKDLKEGVLNQLPEVLPVDENAVTTAWQILNKNDTEQEVLIAAVSNDLLNSYQSVAKKLGLRIVSLEMESLATGRAVLGEIKNNKGVLFLDIGARTTNIVIFDSYGLRSTYSTKIAGSVFTELLAKDKKISLAEAEKEKMVNQKLLNIYLPAIKELEEEIQKSVNYFEETTNKNIEEGIVIGGSALLSGLVEYLKGQLKIDLQLGNPFTKFANYDKITSAKDKALYANVVGLAKKAVDSDDHIINFIK